MTGLTFGVGEALGHVTQTFAKDAAQYAVKAAAHSAVGCASTAAAGGNNYKAGAMAAGFSSMAGPYLPGGGTETFDATSMLGRMVVGGIASKLGGGKFENGAMTAAMEYLFNEVGDRLIHKAKTNEWFGLKGKIFDSGMHEYTVENSVCKWSEANCSLSSVVDAIRSREGAVPCALINCGSAAGSWSFIGPVNFVTHREIENGIMNITTPVHGLDGVVLRVAVTTELGISIRTWGFGVGQFANLNTNFFGKVWDIVDASIRAKYSK
ncbi:MAG: hypothetical protein RLZZ502_848 [Pseudomonadota bacterium]|jgi:hypothetical protein